MSVFPELRRRFSSREPDHSCWNWDGAPSPPPIRSFDEPGVTVEDAVVDIRPWLETCALHDQSAAWHARFQHQGDRVRCSRKGLRQQPRRVRAAGSPRAYRAWCWRRYSGNAWAPLTQMLVNEPSRLRLEKVCVASLSHFFLAQGALRQEGVYRTLLGSGRAVALTPWPYDLTAEFYDEDMGRNADSRDGSLVRGGWQARRPPARTGLCWNWACGTGRITLPLAAAGLDVVAIDRSLRC